jgi:argininosuccinate lyase
MVVAEFLLGMLTKPLLNSSEHGTFQSPKKPNTHEGSINNLCLAEIKEKMKSSFSAF